MLTALYAALLIAVIACGLLVLFFGAQVLLGRAALKAGPGDTIAPFTGRICVLVPAHDEAAGIAATLRDIRVQLRASDRIVVVADNCSDDTAALAMSEAAEVCVRHDAARRGKGYALDWGMRHIAMDPPDVVIIVDADCRLSPGAIQQLAATASSRRRPIQALYLMTGAASDSIGQRVSGFAWLLKNRLRPLGLKRAGLPCQLMGTGMAFPWDLLRGADLANGDLVEDMRLGLDLAQDGAAPVFLPQAIVWSTFPATEAGALAQRQRWEQGHLRTITALALPRLVTSLVRRNVGLAAMCLDLMIPPVSLLVLIVAALLTVSAASVMIGSPATAFVLCGLSTGVLIAAIVAAWFAVGRSVLPASALRGIPAYVARKIPIYTRFATGRSSKDWVRSDRT